MSLKATQSAEENITPGLAYDDRKKEVRNSLIFGVSFLIIGLIGIIIGFSKYSSITRNAQDSSENIDAWSWIILAVGGAIILAIGFIASIKALIAFNQINSVISHMKTHLTPYQQELNRSVAENTQSQSLQPPEIKGAAEDKDSAENASAYSSGTANYSSSGSSISYNSGSNSSNGSNSGNEADYSDIYAKYNAHGASAAVVQNNKAQEPPLTKNRFSYGSAPHGGVGGGNANYYTPTNSKYASPSASTHKEAKFGSNTYGSETANLINAYMNNNYETGNQSVNTSTVSTASNYFAESGHKRASSQSNGTIDYDLSLFGNAPKSASANAESAYTAATQSESFYTAPSQAADTAYPAHPQQNVENTFSDTTQADSFYTMPTQTVSPIFTATTQTESTFSSATQSNNFYTAPMQTTNQNMPPVQNHSTSYAPSAPDTATYTSAQPQGTADTDEHGKYKGQYGLDYTITLNDKSFETYFPPEPENQEKAPEHFSVKTFLSGFDSSKGIHNTQSSQGNLGGKNNFYVAAAKFDEEKRTEAFDLQAHKASNESYTQTEQPSSTSGSSASNGGKYNFDLFTNRTSAGKNMPDSGKPKSDKSSFFSTGFSVGKKKEQDDIAARTGSDRTSEQPVNREICVNGTRSQRKFVDASEYDEWVCPQCGKVNQEYVGVCCCGRQKPRKK